MYPESSNEISSFEKFIYNEYLRTSRTVQNKPWRPRKNFSKFSEEQALNCRKIAKKLESPNINIADFFYAPFFEHKNNMVDFSFYATPKAISTYIQYMRYIDSLPPDDEIILKKIVESLNFIKNYCLENGYKTLQEYFTEDKNNNGMIAPLIHLKQRAIWDYCLVGWDDFANVLVKLDNVSAIKFMLGDDFYDNFDLKRTKFYNSKRCKFLVKEGRKKVENKIK